MATDATGTPTSLGIRKYNPDADAPSGLGFNGAMDDIDALLVGRVAKTLWTTTGDILYASAASTPARLGVGANGTVLTVAGGIPSWAAASGGFAGQASLTSVAAAQSMTATTWIALNLATVEWDDLGTQTGVANTITVKAAGRYLVTGANAIVASAAAPYGVRIKKNGTVIAEYQSSRDGNAGRVSGSEVHTFALNDALTLEGYSNTTQNNIPAETRLQITRVG